jgi:hypothetical protein
MTFILIMIIFAEFAFMIYDLDKAPEILGRNEAVKRILEKE